MKASQHLFPVVSIVIFLGLFSEPRGLFSNTYENPCPEGWFQDLSGDDAQCRELDFDPSVFPARFLDELEGIHIDVDRVLDSSRRAVGFSEENFQAGFSAPSVNRIDLEVCNEGALSEALGRLSQLGGGTVRLPACTIDVSKEISIPSRTIVEGRGPKSSILRVLAVDDAPRGGVLRIDKSQDVVIRDVGIDRREPSPLGDYGVIIHMSDNVLVERTRISGVRVAFWAEHSSNFTIRYNEIRSLNRQSGQTRPLKVFSFGECDQASGQTATTASCESSKRFREANTLGTATMWTAGFAFYSNRIAGPGTWGSSSASVGEIAGNRYDFATGQLKIDDGRFVLVHHNAFADISGAVVFRAATEIGDRHTRWIGFYENLLEHNDGGRYLLNLTSGDEIYLLANRYRGNVGSISFRPNAERSTNVFACRNSEESLPRNAAAHSGLSPDVNLLEADNLLCGFGGGRYLFRQ